MIYFKDANCISFISYALCKTRYIIVQPHDNTVYTTNQNGMYSGFRHIDIVTRMTWKGMEHQANMYVVWFQSNSYCNQDDMKGDGAPG